MSKEKILLNEDNLNLKQACAYYPCHKNIEDKEYDCRMCYCPLYKACSTINNILFGGYLLEYKDSNGNDNKVFACDMCDLFHKKENVDLYYKLKHDGNDDIDIINYFVKNNINK